MKEKFTSDEHFEWRYCEINTASELISYINKIKGCIVGKAIDNIFIQPEFPPNRTHIAGYNILNNNSVECLDLVGPSIIKIDEHLIVFDVIEMRGKILPTKIGEVIYFRRFRQLPG